MHGLLMSNSYAFLQAIYYLAIACGDLMAAAIYSSLSHVLSSLYLLVLYAGLMSLAGGLFVVAAYFYVPATHEHARDNSEQQHDTPRRGDGGDVDSHTRQRRQNADSEHHSRLEERENASKPKH